MSEDTTTTAKDRPRLPYEDMYDVIQAGRLALMLAHKGIISPEDFSLLVISAHLVPRLNAMTAENWEEFRRDALELLRREDPQPPPHLASPSVQKKGAASRP